MKNVAVDEIEYIELCVGDLLQSTRFFTDALGFRRVAEGGPETGLEAQRCVLMQQGRCRVLLTQGLTPESPSSEYVQRHGDGVRDIALRTPDLVATYAHVIERGAHPVREPAILQDGHGRRVLKATVQAMGDVVHSLIEREGPWEGFLPPGLRAVDAPRSPAKELFSGLDHVAICLTPGTLDAMVRFYTEAFGFRQSHEENVKTHGSGMNSKVVQSPSGRICFPMQEPISHENPGQIGEFLARHGGPGVQHLAMLSPDIVASARQLRTQGIEFLDIPAAYYDRLEGRLGPIPLDLGPLREMGILVDRDPWGLLLQSFTRSVHPRQTLFFEAVERKDARGFGGANIRALYEAVEHELSRAES
ncbi:4-hydroxyphenylpyruvate dioxygenase [Corallococcus sp. AB038B]|uniref:4-hydroxyphenylpyruvate dioxygenase n=1 Tax=Corallococcus sp. AB038B TaxID=2316718 RepID=UPI0013158732|nr:4-hydroxyphenylpyruvate dioxygenase [Corallococcus sp. AB038B]